MAGIIGAPVPVCGCGKMQLAFDYLECDKDLADKEWSLYTPYPREAFGDATKTQSLRELGLTERAALLVEDE